ncbi:MAG: helix-turn-helix transcriptional regulator [Eubacteriales bacterium]
MEQKEISQLVQDAQMLIHTQYPYLQGSGDIAEILQVSAPYLIREFTKALGISPTKYLIAYKLEQSKTLLLTENLYVDTVANLVGFSCGNYFSKVFRKHYNMSPSEYAMANKGSGEDQDVGEVFPQLYL